MLYKANVNESVNPTLTPIIVTGATPTRIGRIETLNYFLSFFRVQLPVRAVVAANSAITPLQ